MADDWFSVKKRVRQKAMLMMPMRKVQKTPALSLVFICR